MQPQVTAGPPRDSSRGESYRADIDGLRAIAITSVVLYHLGVPGFAGGFVGVDVFYVISGFLIGGIVFRGIASGSFSFARFYTRRARRIIPALVAVSLFSLATGWLLLPPREYAHAAVSAATALVGASNVRFWLAQGYFTQDPALDPFLMTWSLGVEEQFYLLLPPFLLLLRRLPTKRILSVLWAVAIISAALCVWLTPRAQDAAFYLIPTRAWELAAGVILAVRERGRVDVAPVRGTNVLALLAVIGVAASVIFFSPATLFPGVAAFLPVGATVAFIVAEGSWINRRVLSSAPSVGIGRISYSWYLWHWPILSFLRVCSAGPPGPAALAVAAVLSLAAGYVSWRFVEMPFRRPRPPQPARELPRYAATLAGAFAAALLIKLTGGVPWRVPAATVKLEADLGANATDPCLAQGGQDLSALPTSCRSGGAGRKVVLVGDSHAAALAPGLRAWARSQGLQFEQLTKTSCPPTPGLTRFMPRVRSNALECARFNAETAEAISSDPSVEIVVMSAYWSAPYEYAWRGERYELVNADGSVSPAGKDSLGRAVAATVRRYREAGKTVLVLGPVPSLRFDAARVATGASLPLRRAALRALDPRLEVRSGIAGSDYVAPPDQLTEEQVADASTSAGAIYRSPLEVLCANGSCRFASPAGQPFYSDTHHLSPAGAEYVVQRLGF